VTMGLVLGVIVYQFTFDATAPGNVSASGMAGVVSAFLGAAAIFGGAAVYGYATKRDLTSIGGILVMGLLGLFVVMIVQLFFFAESSFMNLAIGVVGVVIFTGLTAWDVQRLKEDVNRTGFDGDSNSWRNMGSWQTTTAAIAGEPVRGSIHRSSSNGPLGWSSSRSIGAASDRAS
jgi:FtsH-binding integral membrane protein